MTKLLSLMFLLALASVSRGDEVKVVVRPLPTNDGKATQDHAMPTELLDRFQARELAGYGSFTVLSVPAALVESLSKQAKLRNEEIESHPEWDELVLPALTIKTRQKVFLTDGSTSGLFVIQFVGPEKPEWYTDLETSGVKTVNYLSHNGALVWASPSSAQQLRKKPHIQFVRRYDASLKGKPTDLGSSATPSKMTVQFVITPEASPIIENLLKSGKVSNDVTYGNYRNLTLNITDSEASSLLDEPSVVVIERRGIWITSGEREAVGQSPMEGFSSTPPSIVTTSRQPFQYLWNPSPSRFLVRPQKSSVAVPPDFRSWLSSNYALDTSGYKIAVNDTGLSFGFNYAPHPDICSNWSGSTCLSRGIEWQMPAGYESDDGKDDVGHGTMVAVMAVGDPNEATDATLAPADDLNQRFYFGMGIAPKTGLIVQKAFFGGAFHGSASSWLSRAKSAGASVMTQSHNELCCPGLPSGVYSTLDQEYDAAVQSVNIPLTVSAGNIYPFAPEWNCPGSPWTPAECAAARAKEVLPPGLAKNVITVGATEGFRGSTEPTPVCTESVPASWRNARSFNDVAFFSRRGATSTDTRIKPELVAPSSFITSGKSAAKGTSPVYCTENGQLQRYETASGTSFASPQVAAATIILNKWRGSSPTNPMTAPMVKAALSGAATSLWNGGKDWFTDPLNGAAVGARPDNVTGQGWGRLHLDGIFRNSMGQVFYDFLTIAGTGTVYNYNFSKLATTGRTVIVLAWNDPVSMAQTASATLQTDLNLEVVAGGVSYRGNYLAGETSVGWGSYDTVNNLEMVVLPENGSVTSFTVNVRGSRVPETTSYALYLMNAY